MSTIGMRLASLSMLLRQHRQLHIACARVWATSAARLQLPCSFDTNVLCAHASAGLLTTTSCCPAVCWSCRLLSLSTWRSWLARVAVRSSSSCQVCLVALPRWLL